MNKSWECVCVFVTLCIYACEMIMLFSSLASMPVLAACISSVFHSSYVIACAVWLVLLVICHDLHKKQYSNEAGVCVFSGQNPASHRLSLYFVLLIFFHFPILLAFSWMQSIDVLFFMFFYRCLCSAYTPRHCQK